MNLRGSSKKQIDIEESKTIIPKIAPASNVGVYIRTPKSFENAKEYADWLMKGNVVVLYLSQLDGASRNSVFDYMNGVAYIVDAEIGAIDGQVLIYSPKGIKIDKA